MIRFISAPDIHFNPAWLDVSINNIRAVIKAAAENKVDFVAFPGDLYDRAIYATDDGGINELRALIRILCGICPVCAIYGTPSHDYAGSYGPLHSEGLVVLQPGKVYGLWKGAGVGVKGSWIEEESHDMDHGVGIPDCLLFGLPEVTKDWYQSQHPTVSADNVNAECVNMVNLIIHHEYAPMRSAYPNTPAVCLLHGNVSDAIDRGAETDAILKASDIVIRTSVMEEAHMTHWALGHIHTPWTSKRISASYAGYAGIDRNPWGKTGFVPAMQLVTIDGTTTTNVERIPYGTPERVKITAPFASYDSNIAYWLVTDDPAVNDPAKHGGHPWSRATLPEAVQTERRVSSDGLEQTKTLSDIAKLYDKNITEAQLTKLTEAEHNSARADAVQRDVRVASVEITGCKMYHGKFAHIDIDRLPSGLVQVAGPNGSGKSSLLGFCTPYPQFIGKDTESGRTSAIKDFFDGTEAGIKKVVYLNGVKHEHVITIRGAHTQTPKTECYLTIGGEPVLEKSTFDDMQKKCEELYGPVSDYLMTAFYVQPLQGKYDSGLMTASMTSVRDLVQNISGINHETEKRYCLDRANEVDIATKEERIRIDTARGLIDNTEELAALREQKNNELSGKNEQLNSAKNDVVAAENAFNIVKLQYDRMKEKTEHLKKLETEMTETGSAIFAHQTKVAALRKDASDADMCRMILDDDAKTKTAYQTALTEKSAVDKSNADAMLAYQQTKNRMTEITAAVEAKKASARDVYNTAHEKWSAAVAEENRKSQKHSALRQRITDINKPCPNCGFIDPSVKLIIDGIQNEMNSIEFFTTAPEPVYSEPDLSAERTEYAQLMKIPAPVAQAYVMPSSGLSEPEIASYRTQIDTAASKLAEAQAIETQVIPALAERLNVLKKEISETVIEPVDISAQESSLAQARARADELTRMISSLTSEIQYIGTRIEIAEQNKKSLAEQERKLSATLADLADWKYCADLLASNHLPAFELDAVLELIDTKATEAVKPYRNERYIFQSTTQKDGKSGVVDKFDITVLDTETGSQRSLMQFSVGERTFLCDAYTKALVSIRLMRTKTTYNPIISDEQDSFVEIPMIPVFYEVQKNYYSAGERVLVVSHSPDAGMYIQNRVNIEEVVK